MTQPIPSLGAIHFEKGASPDDVLQEVSRNLQASNILVRGVLQCPGRNGQSSQTGLRNITTGEMISISQDLGKKSSGCSLNPGALANASLHLEAELEKPMDVWIMNRFGFSEAEGCGFRNLIEIAFGSDIPVLLAVKETYLDEWLKFAGPLAQQLPADVDKCTRWCLSQIDMREGDVA